ncbi:lactate utilization protein [Desulfosporosinus sp. FKA]|uniref:LutC/YkgG family protein n=1 Tax=Desulfosporosinus sp. FKA TaxID=1969834 RepID=UPI000B4A3FA6|nr:lactate utilization protein [Desulfosporosinus sp. FKA]
MANARSAELYDGFKAKLEAVSGECYRVETEEEAGKLIGTILKDKGVQNVALLEGEVSKKGNFAQQLKSMNIDVMSDNFRKVTPDAQAGITQVSYAIAELGTLVQADDDANVDQRLCSTLVPIHVAVVRTEKLLPSLAETMSTIHRLPRIPGFVGFITGPSRTSDIERVLTIGVHGPQQLIVVFVD